MLRPISLTGSNASFHCGHQFDYGQRLPNSPYIKTNAGFDFLMDNGNRGGIDQDQPLFRIFKGTGIAGIPPGVELFKIDENGNLTTSGSIDGGTY